MDAHTGALGGKRMNIGLIACSKTKLGKDMPEKKFKAQDIYQGNTFKNLNQKELNYIIVMIGLFYQETKIIIY